MMISTGFGTSNSAIASAAVSLPYHESPRWFPPLALRSSPPSSTTALVLCDVAAAIMSLGGVAGGPLLLCECVSLATARRWRRGSVICTEARHLQPAVLLRSLLFASRAPPIPSKAACYESSDLVSHRSIPEQSYIGLGGLSQVRRGASDRLQSTDTTALPAFFTDTGAASEWAGTYNDHRRFSTTVTHQ